MARRKAPTAGFLGAESTIQELEALYSRTRADRARLEQEALAGPIYSLWGRLELLLIVYPIEGLMRLWYHLNPRVYSERLRIRRISEGQVARMGNRHVLFVFYGRDSIPAFTQTIIDAIGRRGLNLVISTNAKISPRLRTALLEKCCLLIERADLGRDFGGYKDGISIIQKRFGTPDRLILLNDSLFYFEKGLDEFIAAFDSEGELTAMTEVFEHHYHLGSFALSFGRQVIENMRVKRYWQSYRPISTRRWSIHKGEVGLTQTLMRAGFRPRVLYHGARLLPHLLDLDGRRLLQVVRLLPVQLRRRIYVDYDEFQQEQRTTTLAAIGTFSRSMKRFESVRDGAHSELRSANVRKLLALNHEAASTHIDQEDWTLVSLSRDLITTITSRNQMHVGGFLFHKFLNMPGVKRDLFYREVFKLEELEVILSELDEPLRETIIEELRQKGTQLHLKGLSRILSKHGSI
jgi:hypothetical protein